MIIAGAARRTHRWQLVLLGAGALLALSQVAQARPGKRRPRHTAPAARAVGAVPLRTATVAPAAPKRRSGGVGMVLDGRGGHIVVARVVPGGPAAQAGVRSGDEVLAIDDVPLPKGVAVSKAAARVRGKVGGIVALRVRRALEEKPLILRVRRADFSLLFPKRAREVMVVEPGLSLLATSGRWSLGVTFPRGGAQGDLMQYQWALAPAGRPLSDANAQRGLGVLAWGRGGATLQIADWRLELSRWPARGRLIIAKSNLPVARVAAADWVQTDPALARYVRPRKAPQAYRATWPSGPCTLRLKAQINAAPAARHRVTLRLTNARGASLPTATVRTDADGVALLRLPTGHWAARGLARSLPGGGRDLFYAGAWRQHAAASCKAGETIDLTVNVQPIAASGRGAGAPRATLPAAAFKHTLVGKPFPMTTVRRWLGGANPLPRTLNGKVMVLYLWATWCGPCKRVSPLVAELHSRLSDRGLVVVPASVDREVDAVRDYAAAQLPGAAPVAWIGQGPMVTLPIRGIPTMVVIDGKGVVRAVHTGTGVSVETWTAWLTTLLDKNE